MAVGFCRHRQDLARRLYYSRQIPAIHSRSYDSEPELANLLLADGFASTLSARQQAWRQTVAKAVLAGVPVPCISSALSYYDSYRSETLPANLLQGQRDFFGAHSFERIDQAANERYHLDWSDPKRPLIKLD